MMTKNQKPRVVSMIPQAAGEAQRFLGLGIIVWWERVEIIKAPGVLRLWAVSPACACVTASALGGRAYAAGGHGVVHRRRLRRDHRHRSGPWARFERQHDGHFAALAVDLDFDLLSR